jgi:SAM-dependent methyltransferase
MQKRHKDRLQYFREQIESTNMSVLPYINRYFPLKAGCRILEVGCGEAGNLYPFLEIGCECYGVELSVQSFKNAKKFYEGNPLREKLHLLNEDIYNVKLQDIGGPFDVIFLRDVIEHIPGQEKFMNHIKQFMADNSVIFFAFPPWRNPFGGHQQICENKWLSKTPYFHLLPMRIYSTILKRGGETDEKIKSLKEIKSTGISINRFEKIIRQEGYKLVEKTYYFINPNYQIKFNLKPRKVWNVFRIPYLQDFYTTAMYYLLKK